MRLIAKIMISTLVLGFLSGCGGASSKSGGSNFSAVSVAVIQNDGGEFTLSHQAVTISLGKLNYWRLRVKAHDETCSGHDIDLAVKQIDDPASARYLDTSHGTSVGGEGNFDSCVNGSFTAQLVAGSYFLTIDGKPTPVTIKVQVGKPTSSTTTAP